MTQWSRISNRQEFHTEPNLIYNNDVVNMVQMQHELKERDKSLAEARDVALKRAQQVEQLQSQLKEKSSAIAVGINYIVK